MSMFLCAKCDNLRDSDDGCEEAPSPPYYPKFGLLCLDCALDDADPEQPANREFSPAQQAIIDAHEADSDEEC